MTKDYKHRARSGNRKKKKNKIALWKWLLAAVLIGSFVSFLIFLRNQDRTEHKIKTSIPAKSKAKTKAKKHIPVSTAKPKFDFYNILPEQEIVIPESEIKIRKREEKLGKAKPSHYVIQAGSFRKHSQADKLKAQLALIGVESKIEIAKNDSTTWNRVKIGPFSKLSVVDTIRIKLRENNIDTIIISTKN